MQFDVAIVREQDGIERCATHGDDGEIEVSVTRLLPSRRFAQPSLCGTVQMFLPIALSSLAGSPLPLRA
jgi:hypothetical protein